MASKRALAKKRELERKEDARRWKRLERLVLALAEKAGIDVDAVLESIDMDEISHVEETEEKLPEQEVSTETEASVIEDTEPESEDSTPDEEELIID
jgi:hypothetical protein